MFGIILLVECGPIKVNDIIVPARLYKIAWFAQRVPPIIKLVHSQIKLFWKSFAKIFYYMLTCFSKQNLLLRMNYRPNTLIKAVYVLKWKKLLIIEMFWKMSCSYSWFQSSHFLRPCQIIKKSNRKWDNLLAAAKKC